ncbi:MAG: hypothetical protein RLP02_03975 [Coleofasciculus sp. C2-GNP5-27]
MSHLLGDKLLNQPHLLRCDFLIRLNCETDSACYYRNPKSTKFGCVRDSTSEPYSGIPAIRPISQERTNAMIVAPAIAPKALRKKAD